jgi:predicted DNA-binding transcriptional regulator AlpA
MEEQLDLVGISEVSEMLGVTRQQADKLSRTSPDFPPPASTLHGGRGWLRSKIEEWTQKTGRAS